MWPSSVVHVFLPDASCDKEFESSRRNFFWDGISKRRMLHLMCWNEVIKPKHARVLGLGSLDVKNWARFAKW